MELSAPLPARVRDDLWDRWGEPHRRHHDRRHLAEVLAAVDTLVADGERCDVDVVRAAAWFHDAVYAGRPDDEARSAELARRLLPPDDGDRVADLVLVTADHRAPDGDAEAAVLCDADLAVLGAGPERYAAYAAAVRAEHAHVPWAVYCRERARIMRALLDLPHLYATDSGRRRWEESARREVSAEVARLERDAAAPT